VKPFLISKSTALSTSSIASKASSTGKQKDMMPLTMNSEDLTEESAKKKESLGDCGAGVLKTVLSRITRYDRRWKYGCSTVSGGGISIVMQDNLEAKGWVNDAFSGFSTTCKNDEVLAGLKSIYKEKRPKKDRRFTFTCNKLVGAEIRPQKWTAWSNPKKDFNLACGDKEALWALESKWNPVKKDRVWRYRCAQVTSSTLEMKFALTPSKDWTGYSAMDKRSTVDCGQGVLKGIKSKHSNRNQDRAWSYHCTSVDGSAVHISADILDANVKANEGDYVSDWHKNWRWECPAGSIIAGMNSFFTKEREDRRFKFKCNALYGVVVTPGDTWTAWSKSDEKSKKSCTGGWVLAGIQSEWKADARDRLYSYKCARLGWQDMGFTMKYSAFTDYANDWNQQSKRDCGLGVLVGIGSYHDKTHKDRRWRYLCSTIDKKPATVTIQKQDWGDYKNKVQEDFTFECPDGSVIAGVDSHSNKQGDRQFKIRCNKLDKMSAKSDSEWSAWGEWEGKFTHPCPSWSAISSIDSKFDTSKKDRRFRFKCAALSISS